MLLFSLRLLAKFEFPARISNKTCLNVYFNSSAQRFMVKSTQSQTFPGPPSLAQLSILLQGSGSSVRESVDNKLHDCNSPLLFSYGGNHGSSRHPTTSSRNANEAESSFIQDKPEDEPQTSFVEAENTAWLVLPVLIS